MNYDFSSLSSLEFEELARDLIQSDRHLFLESFASGPDGGIDFRYIYPDDNINIIGQCKHYIKSGFSNLYSHLVRYEKSKVEKLRDEYPSPLEYIFVTSLALTPGQKYKIAEVFGGATTSDDFKITVLGNSDLNNLLQMYPGVETNHFKLWMTSTNVLERMLNSNIYNESMRSLEEIRNHVRLYVENPSRERAKEIIEDYGYCIISGIPGIGKTTLAEVLILEYVEKHGYELIKIGHTMSEIYKVANPEKKQLFYFDDFLGKTTLDKLQKNEDKDLVSFIKRVGLNRDNWRFILTTREYILQSAQEKYEELDNERFEIAQCVIKIADYAHSIRAKILFNHLYFSDIELKYMQAFLNYQDFYTILSHRNYNPRVIEYMTSSFMLNKIDPKDYVSSFINNLDNPIKIWEHAFKTHISELSRSILLAMSALPDEVLIEDLEQITESFHKKRNLKKEQSFNTNSFYLEIKKLEGNFIITKSIGNKILVEYHSPSIQDFLSFYLSEYKSINKKLYSSFTYFDQFQKLFRGMDGVPTKALLENIEDFYKKCYKTMNSESVKIIRYRGFDGEIAGVLHDIPSWELRLITFLEMVELETTSVGYSKREALLQEFYEKIKTNNIEDYVNASLVLSYLIKEELEEGDFDSFSNENLDESTDDTYGKYVGMMFQNIYGCIRRGNHPKIINVFEAFTILFKLKPELVSEADIKFMRIKFQREKRCILDPRYTGESKRLFLENKLKAIGAALGFWQPKKYYTTKEIVKDKIDSALDEYNIDVVMTKLKEEENERDRNEVKEIYLKLKKFIGGRIIDL